MAKISILVERGPIGECDELIDVCEVEVVPRVGEIMEIVKFNVRNTYLVHKVQHSIVRNSTITLNHSQFINIYVYEL